MNHSANAVIDLIGMLLLLVVFFAKRQQDKRSDLNNTLLNGLMLCLAVILLADAAAWLLDTKALPSARTVCLVLNTLYYVAQICYCRLWLLFVDVWVFGKNRRHMHTHFCFSIPMLIELAVIACNLKTGWIFTISTDNVYLRGQFFAYNLIPFYAYILLALAIGAYGTIQRQDAAMRRRSLSVFLYMFLPICGTIVESVSYGASWLWPFTAVSLLMVYSNMQLQQMSEERFLAAAETEKMARMENELADSRIKIMLSQVQPHFLYNSLSVIQALCETEPAVAAAAITDFSDYLRCNMDSLATDCPIPFSQELQHTKHYLSLEKLRFQDALQVRYDIQTEAFSVPVLSLQPIVENAVRYGVTKRENGGVLTISTRETDMEFLVTVTDTGIGFDPELEQQGGKTHLGIANIRTRLGVMCNGTLEIQSVAGIGTRVVMRLPKTDAK